MSRNSKKNIRNTNGFTLVELLISVMLTGMILITGYSAFQSIIASQAQLTGSIDIQRNLFYLNEKITSLIRQGGSLDYEEYFNRNGLGYGQTQNTDGIYTYSLASEFGNAGTLSLCQVDSSITDENACLGNSAVKDLSGTTATLTGQQKYGQYAALALNYGSTLGFPTPNKLPPVLASTTNGLPELYLIKKLPNNTYERTYFRHVFVAYPGKTCTFATAENCLGKLQMTKLTSCDTDNDGAINTWIPHADFGGEDGPNACTDITNVDDLAWIDITSPDLDVKYVSFLPDPLKIPELMSASGEDAIAPTVQMRLEVALSDLREQKSLAQGTDTRVLMSTLHLHE